MRDNIKQADRQLAERFNVELRANLSGTQIANLAGLFARHYRAGHNAGLEEAAAIAKVHADNSKGSKDGWLIEAAIRARKDGTP